MAIYKSSYLIDSLVMGMKNDVSFVRMHFIQFVCELIQPMNQILKKQQEFASHMKALMECYCELLKKVDVTIYSTQSEQQSLLNDERNVSFKRNQRPQT